jgi:hypothetical protein
VNGIGIDHQRDRTLVVVREGDALVPIGDGRVWSIPSRADAAGRWGSWALAAAEDLALVQAAQTSPDLERVFWTGLCQRLSAHLGGLAPSRRQGFRVAVAVPDPGTDESRQLGGRLAEAGLPDAEIVASTDALLAAWLALAPHTADRPTVIATVVAGDEAAWVRAYIPAASSQARASCGPIVRSPGTGHSAIVRRVLDLLLERLPELPDPAALPALANGILAFAEDLSRAVTTDPASEIAWRGSYAAGLYTPLRLTPAEMASWPEPRALRVGLPLAVREAVQPLGEGRSQPDLIVLGGLGSAWPFAAQALVGLGVSIWPTPSHGDGDDPRRLVATGATFWNGLQYTEIGTAPRPGRLDGGQRPPEPPVLRAPTPPVRPPWQRRDSDAFTLDDPE